METSPGRSEASRGSGIPLRDLRDDARRLSLEEFEDRHGGAFLLLTTAQLAIPRGPATTEVRLADDDPVASASTASLALLAFPLCRTGRSAGHLITIGRASNNDVVIPDLSISRFHAFVKEGGAGSWLLQDAGSTNGTLLGLRSVPQQGNGPALDLKSGENVRLGQVELTFLDAEGLRSYLQKLER